MPKDLPPLTALRAFEAAGRHMSITRAADELSVTTAAVSHQVKALEDYLEVRLFRRTGNSLFLTDAGQAFLPGLRAGFAELERAMNALREHDLRGAFVLSVAPVFATRWLIPRLDGFHGAHPDIDVRISTSLELVDFERDGIDAAIRVGRGRYPGLVAHRLFGESVVPMCSPALLQGEPPLAVPEDLRHHVLLHFDWPAQEQVTPGLGHVVEVAGGEGDRCDPRAALHAAGLRHAGGRRGGRRRARMARARPGGSSIWDDSSSPSICRSRWMWRSTSSTPRHRRSDRSSRASESGC